MPPEAFDSALGASYVLDERIGAGATGEVWRATDRRSGETVAAKVLHREHLEDDTLVERFVRERSILVGLRHPNVVAVRDLVVEGERLAIVMELVGGGSLRDTLTRTRPAPPGRRVPRRRRRPGRARRGARPGRPAPRPEARQRPARLGVAVPRAGRGQAVRLRHRRDRGRRDAAAAPASSARRSTWPPNSSSPVRGTCPADVYSAGILLYELLGGRTPYAGAGTGYAVAHRHVTSEPPRLPVPDPVWDVDRGHARQGPGAAADGPGRRGAAAAARPVGQRPGRAARRRAGPRTSGRRAARRPSCAGSRRPRPPPAGPRRRARSARAMRRPHPPRPSRADARAGDAELGDDAAGDAGAARRHDAPARRRPRPPRRAGSCGTGGASR